MIAKLLCGVWTIETEYVIISIERLKSPVMTSPRSDAVRTYWVWHCDALGVQDQALDCSATIVTPGAAALAAVQDARELVACYTASLK